MPVVAINAITIGAHRRPLKEGRVTELMESIQTNGLLNPITLDQNLTLIAGLHRLTACQLLGFQQIECQILQCENSDYARLAEIDENLIRSELEALERAELWLERDRLLERLGLRAQSGDNQYRRQVASGSGEMISPPLKTTLDLAKESGYTDRTFQLGKQIARDITPTVKAKIKGTPVAKSTTALLKVARAGAQERRQAEQAEQAMANLPPHSAEHQALTQLAATARDRQQELQLVTFHSVVAEREAKTLAKQRNPATRLEPTTARDQTTTIAPGDEWLLGRHCLYCGPTDNPDFIHRLPSHAALAIASATDPWTYDYLINEAQIVAVLGTEGSIHRFCRQHHLPFQFEFFFNQIYLAVFSKTAIPIPQKPTSVEGIESAMAYLVSLYTQPGNFVVGTHLGHGELLVTCERMGRVCFTGDANPSVVRAALGRWQNLTGKRAAKPSTLV